MLKEEWRKVLPIIQEWCEDEDNILRYLGVVCENVNFTEKPGEYSVSKPNKLIIVNGVEVPRPETQPPQEGKHYYTASYSSPMYRWNNDDFDREILELGLLYLDIDDAKKRFKAMCIQQ